MRLIWIGEDVAKSVVVGVTVIGDAVTVVGVHGGTMNACDPFTTVVAEGYAEAQMRLESGDHMSN